jgi:hypothetical protein
MKTWKEIFHFTVVISLFAFVGCGSNTVEKAKSQKESQDKTIDNSYFELFADEGERLRNPPPSAWHFPNYECGPMRPQPNHVNFYQIDNQFPSYLLCSYHVEETHYNKTKEPIRFKDSLEQIRELSPKEFPPLEWIVVAICNVDEHKGASTFEKSFKVGAIFKANMVFDNSKDLSQLVDKAVKDRHPFMYDSKQPHPDQQQRWVIVERHASSFKSKIP